MRTLMRPSCGRRFSAMFRWLKFNARNDRGLEALELRRTGNFLQFTVDAITDAKFISKGSRWTSEARSSMASVQGPG